MLRILHISDFHINEAKINASKEIVRNLVNQLTTIQHESSVDLVIFSGDAIDRGNGIEDGSVKPFKLFEEVVIEEILRALSLDRSRFIITPGNHDIHRDAVGNLIEIGLRSEIKDEKAIETYASQQAIVSRCATFKQFERDFYNADFPDFQKELTSLQSSFRVKIRGLEIGITSMNSSWRCSDSKVDHLHNVVGVIQLEQSLAFLNGCDILLAVAHHHSDYLKEFDRKLISEILMKRYSMYFTGHTHSPDADCHIKPSGCLYNFVSAGVLSDNIREGTKYKNGFSVIDYDLEKGECTVQYYLQQPNKEFELDTKVGENGKWTTNFPIGEEAAKKRQIQSIFSDISEQVPTLNEHLLGWSKSSGEHQNIKDMFVMPDIRYDKIVDPATMSNEDVDIHSIEEIINIKGNILVGGTKESGKTVLLDKILLELIDRYSRYNIIPVRLDFMECKDIVSRIGDFWRQSNSKVKEILQAEQTCLLIDDFDVEQSAIIHNKIVKFCQTYPNTRVIATCKRNVGMDFSTTLRSSELGFTVLEIKPFGARHVRELTKRWFNKVEIEDDDEQNISTIIDTLSSLNLPPSPFAISMFLWILQYRSASQPKNQASLMSFYLNELLKRGSEEVGNQNDYNPENMTSLLIELSMAMLRNESGEMRTGILVKDIIDCITEHLNQTGLRYLSATRIYSTLIDTGILIETEQCVRFRFTCFQDYYIANAMLRDNTVKAMILKDYLKHQNEVIIYTGLKIYDEEVLKTIIGDLSIEFDEIQEIIQRDYSSNPDNCFNYTKSFIGTVEEELVSELLPRKQTEEDKIRVADEQLSCESATNEGEADVETEIEAGSPFKRVIDFGDRLVMAMNVLRNVEELKNNELKANAYEIILRKSFNYAFIYSSLAKNLLRRLDPEKLKSKESIQLMLSTRFVTVLNLDFLVRNLGSMKLSSIIEEKIKCDARKKDVSEFERFMSVFLFVEIKGAGHRQYLTTLCNQYRRAYIADAIYMKLMHYYHVSLIKDDQYITNLIADVYIKQHNSENPNKSLNKSNIIRELEAAKSKSLRHTQRDSSVY